MTHVTDQICTKNMKTLACTYNIYNKLMYIFVFFALCSTGHGMRYGLNNTTKVILLTAVVRDIVWSTAVTSKQRDVVLIMLLLDSNVL